MQNDNLNNQTQPAEVTVTSAEETVVMEKTIDKKKNNSSRTFSVGLYSIVVSVAVIVIAVIINLAVGQLPTSVTKQDMTMNQLFTLSEQTKEIISELDEEITIYLIAQTSLEDAYITELLDRYQELNDNITVTVVDPVVYPNFASQYTTNAVYNNSIVVESAERSYYLSYYDIYIYDYTLYYMTNDEKDIRLNFDGESALTSAISYVVSEEMPTLYVLGGHSEYALADSFRNALLKQNIGVQNLTLLTQPNIPDDCSCLLIYGPSSDINQSEYELISDYLAQGGNLFMVSAYPSNDLPNLTRLMNSYGVEAVDGIVVEGDSSHCLYTYQHYILPKLRTHDITDPLIGNNYYVLAPISEGLVVADDKPSDVTVTQLLLSTDKSYAKLDGATMTTFEKEEGDIDGPFALAVAIKHQIKDNTDARLVWFATPNLLDASVNEMVAGGNLDLFINAVGWMCQWEQAISIHAKNLDTQFLIIPNDKVNMWSIILIGFVPLVFLVLGIVVWTRRKRR